MRNKVAVATLIIFILLAALLIPPISCYALESATYTYTLSTDGAYIHTQDAYMAGGIYLDQLELKAPEDFCIDNGLYVYS